jgi:Raf kinase inhibitor-like YbhB/YbcL family protein
MFCRYSSIIAVVIFTVGLSCWSEALAADKSAFELRSSAFAQKGDIPSTFTCDGKNLSPPLAWSGAPAGTQSYTLIVDDPDAPDPKSPKTVWTHWVMYNIPTRLTALPDATALPPHAQAGINDFKAKGYRGPCPPAGKHRYMFKLYALDTRLNLSSPPAKAQLELAMKAHVLGQATLVGVYGKK